MRCDRCGAELSSDDTFCGNCGKKTMKQDKVKSSPNTTDNSSSGQVVTKYANLNAYNFSTNHTRDNSPNSVDSHCSVEIMSDENVDSLRRERNGSKKVFIVLVVLLLLLILFTAFNFLLMTDRIDTTKYDFLEGYKDSLGDFINMNDNKGGNESDRLDQSDTEQVSAELSTEVTQTTEQRSSIATTESVQMGYAVGDVVLIGSLDQDNNLQNGNEDIEWIILDKKGDQYLVISKYAIACLPYNSTPERTSWPECSLRNWLNSNFFFNAFSSEEQQHINETNSPLSDKVFVLSASEVKHYFESEPKRRTGATQTAIAEGSFSKNGCCGWWLRDIGDSGNTAARVNVQGEIVVGESTEGGVERQDYSVRPSMWIILNK